MNKNQINILEQEFELKLTDEIVKAFLSYEEFFIQKNKIINLISKNDEKLLFEKHIFDSLAINLFFTKHNKLSKLTNSTLLDIGTGGGFPSVPIALTYPEITVYAIDSIRKKVNVIEEIKQNLNLQNLFTICDRAEAYAKKTEQKFDYITTRAVAPIETILKFAIPNLKTGGFFIAYKSKKAIDELKEAKSIIKQNKLTLVDIIEYTLPLDEIFERNLIIFKK